MTDKPRRIAFVLDSLGRGGTQKVVLRLSQALYERYGLHSLVLGLDANDRPSQWVAAADHPGRSLVELGLPRWRPGIAPLRQALADYRPDLVICLLFKASVLGALACRALGLPYVLADRSVISDLEVVAEYVPRGLRRLYRRLYVQAALGARRLWLFTPVHGQAYERLGVPWSRMVFIPNGIETRRPSTVLQQRAADGPAVRLALGTPVGRRALIWVNRLHPQKQLGHFLALIARLADLGLPIEGWVVGEGQQQGVLDAAIAAGVPLRALGYRTDVPRLMHAADLLVHTNAREAYPNVVLEALAAGAPVAAATCASTRHALAGGAAGVLYHEGDIHGLARLLVPLLADVGHYHTVQASALAHVQGLSWEATIAGVWERILIA